MRIVRSPSEADRNLVIQQGYEEPAPQSCASRSAAIRFQPKLIGAAALLGVVLQSPHVFGALAVVLWWSALLPRYNPFEAFYNATRRMAAVALPPAQAPRRFAQGMAGTINAAIGLLLLRGASSAALALEGILLVAVVALVFGKLCFGSFVFHLVRGRVAFALGTLPWARPWSHTPSPANSTPPHTLLSTPAPDLVKRGRSR